MSGDFEKADQEAGIATVDQQDNSSAVFGGDVTNFREKLIQQYHGGASSLVQRLSQQGYGDTESLLMALIDEIVRETDNLLGNHLIATQNGDLRDSSVISYKRSEVLEKAIKAVQSKREFEKQEGIDVDSPSMVVVFRYFLSKVKVASERIDMPQEQIDLFFEALSEGMDHWKRELREEFETMRTSRQNG